MGTFTTSEISTYQQRKRRIKEARQHSQKVRQRRKEHIRLVLTTLNPVLIVKQDPVMSDKMPAKIRRVRWGVNTTRAITWSCPSRPGDKTTRRITVAEGRI